MSKRQIVRSPAVSSLVSEIDSERCAHWLLSAYSDSCWVVTNSNDPQKKATIDFRFVLSDGRPLVEAERLCATVKEFAWWIRDPRYSRTDTAARHAENVGYMMKLAHALTLRKLGSFSHIQPYDLEGLVEECRYGLDAVLHAFERVDMYLTELKVENEIDPKLYGGLPRYGDSPGSAGNVVDTVRILAACNLPRGASTLPRVSARIAQSALASGLKVSTYRPNEEIPLLSIKSSQTIRQWLYPLEQLFIMRRQIMAETITFKPFPYGAGRVAKVKGVGCAHTPTPPPMLMLHLLEHAARIIFDQSSIPTNLPKDWQGIINLTTACWIIIAAFTARRSGEIDDLSEGCLCGDKDSGWWLHVYIEKTLQRKEQIPVPSIVAKAVETMSAISATARLQTKTERLFLWQRSDGKVMRLNVTRKIDDFAAAVNVPQHIAECGTYSDWHWHPHQFRRFFAVLYFYRFEGASIEVLSHHLRHFDLEMTKKYITQDNELAALWTDVEWGYTGHMARSIVAGERSVAGAAGEKLKKTALRLMKLFRQKLQVASPDRVGASLTLMMQREGLVLTPKPWATCSCPQTLDAALKAACRRDMHYDNNEVGPDFARSGPSVCCHCPHAIMEGSRKPIVDTEIAHLDAVVSSGVRKGTLFGDLESARVVDLHRVSDTMYKAAVPLCFEDITE